MISPKSLYSSILLTTLFISSSVFSNEPTEKDLINVFADSFNYIESHQADIWPGYNLPGLATIIEYDPSGNEKADISHYHLYAFDFKPTNPLWQKMDFKGRLTYYMPQNSIHLSEHEIANVDGQPVLPFLVNRFFDPTSRVINFNSQKFSYYVAQHFHMKPMITKGTRHFFQNEDNIRLAALEIEAMKAYLQNNDAEALKDMLAIRQYRSRFMSAETKQLETRAEQSMGMSYYVGLKSAHLDQKSENAFILHDIINNMPTVDPHENDFHLDELTNYLEVAIGYDSGAVIGLALDRIGDKQWKMAVEKENASPINLLFKYYPMKKSEITRRVNNASAKYHFKVFASKLKNTLAGNDAGIIALQNKYDNSPGIPVELSLRKSNLYSDSSDNLAAAHEYAKTSDTNAYAKLKKSWIFDKLDFHLQYTDIPVVFETSKIIDMKILPDYNFQFTNEVTDKFKLSANTHLVIDGVETTLSALIKSNKNLHFHQLRIKNPRVNISFDKDFDGELTSNGGMLKLKIYSLEK
ncbi:MAG: hypothetical protein SFW66_04705 [Gammaproteobacteria bacterium]|nr:hypothetical protein [Gammaproteobacteria bacterium]